MGRAASRVPAASGVTAVPLEDAAEESTEDEAELAASGTAGERGWPYRLKARRSACCQSLQAEPEPMALPLERWQRADP